MNINGYLMSKDTVLAKIANNRVYNKNNLFPLYLQRNGDLLEWIKSRAIDAHRPNSRILKKALRLTNSDDIQIAMQSNCATLTDTYWIKTDDNTKYADVKINNDYFSDLALKGDINVFSEGINNRNSRTFELTNIGSYEKCWKIKNNQWFLYKNGSKEELFSELFIYELGKSFNFNMAEYSLDGEYIISKDFTYNAKYNFEPMASLLDGEEDYTKNYECLRKLNPKLCSDYINMIYLDTLCFNMDRHTYNYGVLRDVDTGDVISMAPNFDNNIALISRGYKGNIDNHNDLLIQLFSDFIKDNKITFSPPSLCEKKLQSILDKINLDVDKKYVFDFIANRYKSINNILTKDPIKDYCKDKGVNFTPKSNGKER